MAWNNPRVKRVRSTFQCQRFMHQNCPGPKTPFMRHQTEDPVPGPQAADRPVCGVHLQAGFPDTQWASEMGHDLSGLWPLTAPVITVGIPAQQMVKVKKEPIVHVHWVIIQQSIMFSSNEHRKWPQKCWQLSWQYLLRDMSGPGSEAPA